jgi:WD40 repeat protein
MKKILLLTVAFLFLSACATPQVQKTLLPDNSNVVTQAENELSGARPEVAALLALEALENYVYTPQAENALAQAVQQMSPDVVQLAGQNGSTNDAQWSPDGQWIATTGPRDKPVCIWKWPGGELARTLEELPANGYYLAWSPDGKRLAIATESNAFSVWDTASWEQVWEIPISSSGWLYVQGWSPDGKRLAASGAPASFSAAYTALLDAETGQELAHLDDDQPGYMHLRSQSWSPQGDRLVTGALLFDGSKSPARVWDAASGEVLLKLPEQEGSTTMGVYSPDGRYIATISGSGLVRVWDAESGQPVSPEVNLADQVLDIHWSPNGARIVVGATSKGVIVLDALTGAQVASYELGNAMKTSVAWAPDGKHLLVAISGTDPSVLPAWQTTEELVAYAKECCAKRELTKEERAKFGLP